MGDSPTPPPLPEPSNTPMLYYGIIIIGTAIVVIVVYHFLLIKLFPADQQTGQGREFIWWRTRFHTSVSTFNYRKDNISQDDSECAVCLSEFEEGHQIRQLHRCNHSFHAPCIDMWLYSHMDCPLCRTPVLEPPPEIQRHAAVYHSEHSHEGLLGAV